MSILVIFMSSFRIYDRGGIVKNWKFDTLNWEFLNFGERLQKQKKFKRVEWSFFLTFIMSLL